MVETTENRVKIGAKVEESVYASFKQHVYDETGQKRGVLGEAVEAALIDYMDDDAVSDDGEVSNSDLLREIRALRHSDATPAPYPPAEENDSKVDSEDSAASDGGSPPSEETPSPPLGSGKGTLEGDTGAGAGEREGKPPLNSPVAERVDWIASSINISGDVAFDTLVEIVGEQWPQLTTKKCREVAWGWAAAARPCEEDYPDELDRDLESAIATDSRLRARVEAERNPELHFFPREHESGAWFKITDEYSEHLLNHQEPTERGEVVVYLGEGGAVALAQLFGWLPQDYYGPPEADGDGSESWDSSDKSDLPECLRDDDETASDSEDDECTDSDDEISADDLQDAQRAQRGEDADSNGDGEESIADSLEGVDIPGSTR